MSAVPVYIAFGSNVGDSPATLQAALGQLSHSVLVTGVSTLVRSDAMYITDQPPFVNGALAGTTELGPLALLSVLKSIERSLGRQERVKNGPRELDLDIIGYGSLSLTSPLLQIPHPRLSERRFVLQPLAELAPGLVLPGLPPVHSMLAATEDQSASVQPINDAALSIPSSG